MKKSYLHKAVHNIEKVNGQHKAKHTVYCAVHNERNQYEYALAYPSHASDKDIQADLDKLVEMSDEQVAKQTEYEPLYGQDVKINGHSVYVADCAVHIHRAHSCAVLLRFYIRELQQWGKKDIFATTPAQLPSVDDIKAAIQRYLQDIG